MKSIRFSRLLEVMNEGNQTAHGYSYGVTPEHSPATDAEPSSSQQAPVNPEKDAALIFFYGLGKCIDRWAYVDRQLYLIFRLVLKLEPDQASFLFYRVPTFNQRLNLVDDALRTVLDRKEFETMWLPLSYKIKGLSLVRNVFAHHPAKLLPNSSTYAIYIEPYLRAQLRKNGLAADKEEFEIEDLKQHNQAVVEVQRALIEFSRSLNRPTPTPGPARER